MWIRYLLGCGTIMAVSACGGSGLVPAQGKVTLNGEPVNVAMVQFVPDSMTQTQGRVPNASTDKDGNFTMTTQKYGDGVMPGSYRVVVTKTTKAMSFAPTPAKTAPVAAEDDGPSEATQEMLKTMQGMAGPGSAAVQSDLPAIYADAKTTPLRVDIPAEGDTAIELSLKK